MNFGNNRLVINNEYQNLFLFVIDFYLLIESVYIFSYSLFLSQNNIITSDKVEGVIIIWLYIIQ